MDWGFAVNMHLFIYLFIKLVNGEAGGFIKFDQFCGC